jgi:hypothetical protein
MAQFPAALRRGGRIWADDEDKRIRAFDRPLKRWLPPFRRVDPGFVQPHILSPLLERGTQPQRELAVPVRVGNERVMTKISWPLGARLGLRDRGTETLCVSRAASVGSARGRSASLISCPHSWSYRPSQADHALVNRGDNVLPRYSAAEVYPAPITFGGSPAVDQKRAITSLNHPRISGAVPIPDSGCWRPGTCAALSRPGTAGPR